MLYGILIIMLRILNIMILAFILSACNSESKQNISENSSENVHNNDSTQFDTLQLTNNEIDSSKTDQKSKTINIEN